MDAARDSAWARMPESEIRKVLSREEYRVTRENGTEPAFLNALWNNKEAGLYVDVLSGEPLFSSADKYDSGTGWPSFSRPLFDESLVERRDLRHGMERTEVRSLLADSHLGHVFPDGPPPTGFRYCINSAALRFIPADSLDAAGYGPFRSHFFPLGSAVFAAGCFWGVEAAFRKVPGVSGVVVGYTGGWTENPAYEDVCTGQTGHAEAVWVDFDPEKISFDGLLRFFWSIHDPTTLNRQGPDAGTQYRSAIFGVSAEQLDAARRSKAAVDASGRFSRPVVTRILPAGPFYVAEDYHQRYLEKRRARVGF